MSVTAEVRMCDKELESMKEGESKGNEGKRERGGYGPWYHNMKSKFELTPCLNKPVGECLFSPLQQREAGSTGTPGPLLPST